MSDKPVVLSNGAPEEQIVDDSRLDFLLQKPSSRGIGRETDCVVILHAPLPAAETGLRSILCRECTPLIKVSM